MVKELVRIESMRKAAEKKFIGLADKLSKVVNRVWNVFAVISFLGGTLFLCFSGEIVRAENSSSSSQKRELTAELESNCSGQLYRAKRDNVPVYKQADAASEVVVKLGSAQRVCYVGEKKGFAVIDRFPEAQTEELTGSETQISETGDRLAYVRTYDLWPPRGKSAAKKNESILSKTVSFIRSLQYNSVPSGDFEPHPPLLKALELEDEAEGTCEESCSVGSKSEILSSSNGIDSSRDALQESSETKMTP